MGHGLAGSRRQGPRPPTAGDTGTTAAYFTLGHDVGGLLCGRPSAVYSSRFGASMNLRHAGQVKIGP